MRFKRILYYNHHTPYLLINNLKYQFIHMEITGLRTERVTLKISKDDFMNKLWEFITPSKHKWIRENDKGNLAIFYDAGGHSFMEIEERELTAKEVEYYKAVMVINKFIEEK